MLEDAARSWESAVDMVHARIPDMIRPAITIPRIPLLLIRAAITMISFSESVPSSVSIMPPLLRL